MSLRQMIQVLAAQIRTIYSNEILLAIPSTFHICVWIKMFLQGNSNPFAPSLECPGRMKVQAVSEHYPRYLCHSLLPQSTAPFR